MTTPGGRFLISGLRPGLYALTYRSCSAAARDLPPALPGAVASQAHGQVLVTAGQVKVAAPATLRPATPAALLARATPAWLRSHVATDTLTASAKSGRIAGKVTDKAGHPLRGICVIEFNDRAAAFYESRTTKTGGYLSKPVRPGRYQIAFLPGCGNNGNWLLQFYKNTSNESRARQVKVTAGKTTAGINAAMALGGEIRGTVTNTAGKKLTGICVSVSSAKPSPPSQASLGEQASTRNGTYQAPSLPPGKYVVQFSTGCGNSGNYAPQQWKNKLATAKPTFITVTSGHVASRINAVMKPGAEISGTVTLGTSTGTPLGGICVFADGSGAAQDFSGFTETAANGTYLLKGMIAGKWQMQFSTGCSNNGNYLPDNLPGVVTTTTGSLTPQVDAILQPGGVVSGVVTNSHGTPVPGICVEADASNGDNNEATTASNGSYRIDQLPTSQYEVSFNGGCGNKGSYAPQFYNDQAGEGAATLVPVTQGKTTSPINAAMLPGGTITGRVTSAAGKKLSGVCVSASQDSLFGLGGLVSSVRGQYSVTNLTPGQYQVSFSVGCGITANLAAQSFRDRPGSTGGQLISVDPGTTTGGISAVMRPGGTISGVVTSKSGRALPNVCATATDLRNGSQTQANDFSTKAGRYSISGLAAGRYSVEFSACGKANLAEAWYRNSSTASKATPVVVRAGRTTSGIGSVMTPGGTITGVVTNKATGNPLRGVCVEAFTANFAFGNITFTGKHGGYTLPDLNTGSYTVQFSFCAGGPNLASQARAGTLRVTAGKTRARINAALVAGGSVSGAVLGGTPGVPQADICVVIDPTAAGGVSGLGFTGQGGTFTARNLLPGTYKVLFDGDSVCGSSGFVSRWYLDQPSQATATLVTVSAGQTTALTPATLAADGQISGTVTGPAPAHAPLTGACVTAVPAGPGVSVTAESRGGKYSILAVSPGRYRVEFGSGCGVTGYATQWWKAAASKSKATIISVPANVVTAGISAVLKH